MSNRRFAVLPIAGSLLVLSCSPPPEPVSLTVLPLDLSAYALVDLSHAYDENTLYWPTSTERFELQELAYGPSEDGWFYSSYGFSSPEHGGTHLDAPIHFAEGGQTVDEIPLDRLVAPAVVIDVREAAAENADYRLTLADLKAWENEHGLIPTAAAVLLLTGWDEFWPAALPYLGDDTPGDATNLRFPSFGEEAVRFLIEERGIDLLGVDTASIDYGASDDFIVHRIANGAGLPGLENLTGLDRLPARGAWIVALPMKIAGGSGGPVRVIALVGS